MRTPACRRAAIQYTRIRAVYEGVCDGGDALDVGTFRTWLLPTTVTILLYAGDTVAAGAV